MKRGGVPVRIRFAVLLIMISVAVVALCLVNLPAFSVKYVSVDSSSDDISENVRKILLEPVGKSIFIVSTAMLEKKLIRQASVCAAEVSKVYPDKIRVTLI